MKYFNEDELNNLVINSVKELVKDLDNKDNFKSNYNWDTLHVIKLSKNIKEEKCENDEQ